MTAFHIGPYAIEHPVMLAPMAGVTDRPFRVLCRKLGASYAVSEMLSCDLSLLKTAKTQFRMNHDGEPGPIAVQIAGSDPELLAQAARCNVENGAQIIDINMGCPHKKVAKKNCGSALLANPNLVAEICQSVVNSVDVPVTLKTRLGIDDQNKNIKLITKIAEESGIQAISIHGRTKIQKYQGQSEYDLIATVKSSIKIPVIANGDINTPEKAKEVMKFTRCDGVMIGRAAQGNPWIFNQINHYLNTGKHMPKPSQSEIIQVMYQHISQLHDFYGSDTGHRIARKHIKWFLNGPAMPTNLNHITRKLMTIKSAEEQLVFINQKLLRKAA